MLIVLGRMLHLWKSGASPLRSGTTCFPGRPLSRFAGERDAYPPTGLTDRHGQPLAHLEAGWGSGALGGLGGGSGGLGFHVLLWFLPCPQ